MSQCDAHARVERIVAYSRYYPGCPLHHLRYRYRAGKSCLVISDKMLDRVAIEVDNLAKPYCDEVVK